MPLRGRRRGATVALAGAGSIATVHALAASAAGCRVVAVASAGGTTARHLAGQLDARRCRPEDLPAGADLLVVATPPEHHVDLTLRGLAGGAAVLVEKPIATTLAGADRLVEAASRLGAPVLRCAENLVHAPAWRELVRRRPALGDLSHLSVRALQPPPTWGHFTRPLTAGGVLFDLGPHPVALVLELVGAAPVGVRATLRSGRDDGADDHAEVDLRFGSGLVARIEVSWSAPTTEWALQAASPGGVLRWELFPGAGLEADGEPVPVPDRVAGLADPRLERLGYVAQLADLAASARGEDRPGQSAAAARDVLEVICAAYASAGTGTEVTLPLDGGRDRTPMSWWRG
jgi:predicted dehydrogenase